MTRVQEGPKVIGRDAVLSEPSATGAPLYRYSLTRDLDGGFDGGGAVAFLLCNPSTADHRVDDPTVRKCIGFAFRWGMSRVVMVNRAAYRATRPADLLSAHRRGWDVIGPDNAHHVACAVVDADLFVVAWGNAWPTELDPIAASASEAYLRNSGRAMCLGRTASGAPRHPLMLAYSTPLEEYLP